MEASFCSAAHVLSLGSDCRQRSMRACHTGTEHPHCSVKSKVAPCRRENGRLAAAAAAAEESATRVAEEARAEERQAAEVRLQEALQAEHQKAQQQHHDRWACMLAPPVRAWL